MEDIKDVYPNVYRKSIKKAGNDFITEVEKMGDNLYKQIDGEPDKDLKDFYYEVSHFGNTFRNWLKDL
jgi:hypothetical protein